MAHSSTPWWEAPTFSFNTKDQAAACRNFYTRPIDNLETLDIDPEREDENKKGWKQIKMMFTGEDRHALQTMIDNNTITPEDQLTPIHVLEAIQTMIKEEEHYCHYRDEIMIVIRQQPNEQIHTLNTRNATLVNNCRFQDQQTTEIIKIMLLQHAIKIHEARDWIWLQDLATLTYQTLLNHCKLLEQWCEQFQKAQQKGKAELTSIAATSTTSSSIHQDSISIHHNQTRCYRCGHNHPKDNCPAYNQWCYNCNNIGHYTALCRTQTHQYSYGQSRHYHKRPSNWGHSSRSSSRDSSTSPRRSRHSKVQLDTHTTNIGTDEAHTTSHWFHYNCRTQHSI